MAADAWKKYNRFPELLGNKVIDLDADTIKVALYTSASNANTVTNDDKADLTNEVAQANGYTTGGAAVTPAWSFSGGTTTFDISDPQWTASGGSITARYAVIWDDTPTTPIADPLIAYSLLDNTPADVTVTDGNTLTIQINASGVFTVTGM